MYVYTYSDKRDGYIYHTYVCHDSHTMTHVRAPWLIYVCHDSYTCAITYVRHDSSMRIRHVTCENESCHAFEWVMSHILTMHVTRITESWHTYEWGMSHAWLSHAIPCVCCETSYVCRDNFICVPWQLHTCAVTPAHVCHDSNTCAMTKVCHDLV